LACVEKLMAWMIGAVVVMLAMWKLAKVMDGNQHQPGDRPGRGIRGPFKRRGSGGSVLKVRR
jgi:hypothetical protein